MLNGKIIRSSRQKVEGSFKMSGYSDSWLESVDFVFDGEITDEVVERIEAAVYKSGLLGKCQSYWGALRYRGADMLHSIDVAKKQVLIHCCMQICD